MAPQSIPKEPTLPISLPDDPRIEHRFANLNDTRYHYLYAEPSSGKWKATVFLVGGRVVGLLDPMPRTNNVTLQIHGWPDISAGWRFQIPLFLKLGLRVVCPDMMGYGRTVRPLTW
jgi:pimeloyl-ACP methyl ester carboxylesterase